MYHIMNLEKKGEILCKVGYTVYCIRSSLIVEVFKFTNAP